MLFPDLSSYTITNKWCIYNNDSGAKSFHKGEMKFEAPIRPTFTTVAGMASFAAGTYPGYIAAVSDGNAGATCLALSDGSNWKVIALGATISAT